MGGQVAVKFWFREARERELEIGHHGGRKDMGHILRRHHVVAAVVDVAVHRGPGESARVAEFVPVLPLIGAIPAGFIAGVVVAADHPLIVAVLIRCISDIVVTVSGARDVGGGEKIDERLARLADISLRDHVARERRTGVVVPRAVTESSARRIANRGGGVVNRVLRC